MNCGHDRKFFLTSLAGSAVASAGKTVRANVAKRRCGGSREFGAGAQGSGRLSFPREWTSRAGRGMDILKKGGIRWMRSCGGH